MRVGTVALLLLLSRYIFKFYIRYSIINSYSSFQLLQKISVLAFLSAIVASPVPKCALVQDYGEPLPIEEAGTVHHISLSLSLFLNKCSSQISITSTANVWLVMMVGLEQVSSLPSLSIERRTVTSRWPRPMTLSSRRSAPATIVIARWHSGLPN